MGLIANNYADRVYITDDNPRNEIPSKIRKSIITNCKKGIEIVPNINFWKEAPLWDKKSITKATKKWFQYLK